jgi:hypothetical protein
MKKQFGEAYFSWGWWITAAVGLICGTIAGRNCDFRILLGFILVATLLPAFAYWCKHSN